MFRMSGHKTLTKIKDIYYITYSAKQTPPTTTEMPLLEGPKKIKYSEGSEYVAQVSIVLHIILCNYILCVDKNT